MLVDYELPAVVRGTPGRSSKEKHVLCKVQGRSDIREVGAEDAPLAGVIQRTDGHSKYRLFDGHLHAEVGWFSDLRKGGGNKRLLRRAAIEKRLLKLAHSELSALPRSMVNPTCLGLSGAHLNGHLTAHRPPDVFDAKPNAEAVWKTIPYLDGLRLTTEGDEDVDRWRRLADEAFEGVIICDGKVWIKVPEPCIAMFPQSTSCYVTQGDMAFYAEAATSPVSQGKDMLYWRDVQDVCFSVNDWEVATAFSDRHLREMTTQFRPHSKSDIVRLKIFDPSAFSFDFDTAEFRRLAGRVSHLGRTAMRVPSKPAVWKKKVPEPFIAALDQLSDALAEPSWQSVTEAALEHVLDTINRLRDPLSAAGLKCDVFVRSIERGLERWADRPITLETAPHLHGAARIGQP